MSASDSIAQLRQTLDDMSTSRLSPPTPDLEYYHALLRRLEYTFQRETTALSDEAVRVITAEEWSLAAQAKDAAQERQGEIEAMRSHLEQVEQREETLKAEIEQLQQQLTDALDRQSGDAFEVVGMDDAAFPEPEPADAWPVEDDEDVVEFEADTEDDEAWETAEPGGQDAWEVAQPAAEDAWEVAEPTAPDEADDAWTTTEEPAVTAPKASAEALAVEDEIRKIESEIRKIEEELALIAAQERELQGDDAAFGQRDESIPSVAAPQEAAYQTKGYTLFLKQVPLASGGFRPLYFFSKDESRDDADAVPLPDGYTVGANARTKMPYLKRKKR